MRTLGPIVILLVACSAPQPVIEAHRAGAAYAPENSVSAVNLSIEQGYAAIEVDVAVTADGRGILHHGRTADPARCVDEDGSPVRATPLLELHSDDLAAMRCGGTPVPAFPSALVRAEAPMPLVDFIERIRDAHDRTLVHLDLQVEPEDDLQQAVAAVLEPWLVAELPHPFYVSSPHPGVLAAFRTHGAVAGLDVPTSLSWPQFPNDAVLDGIGVELAQAAGTRSVVDAALEAGVDGVALQWEVARRADVQRLRSHGLDVQLWTLDDPRALRVHARWPVTSLITNHPGDRP